MRFDCTSSAIGPVRRVTLLSPPEATLPVALTAGLAAHGWTCTLAEAPARGGVALVGPAIVILEDDRGGASQALPGTPGPHTVYIGSSRSLDRLIEACEAGALVLDQDVPFLRLVHSLTAALVAVDDGHDPKRARILASLRALSDGQAKLALLTPRERDVLCDLTEGRVVAQIAADGFRSLSTVRTQVQRVLLKLDTTSQVTAVALAHRCGLRESVGRAPIGAIHEFC